MKPVLPETAAASPARNRQSGEGVLAAPAFTLVELLLVLTILAVFSGSVVVSLSGRGDAVALRTAANDLAAAIRLAASRARLTGQAHRVVMAAENGPFHIEALPDGEDGFVAAPGMAGRERNLPKGVRVVELRDRDVRVDSPWSLEFFPDGSGFAGRVDMGSRYEKLVGIEVTEGAVQVSITEQQ